jgi:hypothetical protein
MDAAWARSLKLEDVSIVLHRVWQVVWFTIDERNVTGPDKVRTKVPCKRVGATVAHLPCAPTELPNAKRYAKPSILHYLNRTVCS